MSYDLKCNFGACTSEGTNRVVDAKSPTFIWGFCDGCLEPALRISRDRGEDPKLLTEDELEVAKVMLR